MKKIVILFLIFFSMNNHSVAEKVDLETARTVAKTFFTNRYLTKDVLSINERDLNLIELKKEKGIPIYYVFNIGNKGFVIVSGSKKAKPILGYSSDNNLPMDRAFWDEGLVFMLDYFQEQILSAESQNQAPDNSIIQNWKQLTDGMLDYNVGDKVELVLTTKWGQCGDYNGLCPITGVNDHPLGECIAREGEPVRTHVGCVAVAMAQILKYFNYPQEGIGEHTYTDQPNDAGNGYLYDPSYGNFTFQHTTYNWNNMPNNLNSVNYFDPDLN